MNNKTRFLIASDTHYGSVNSIEQMKEFDLSNTDFDCALLAGDIGVYDEEISYMLNNYFKGKKVCFLGGNHQTYMNPRENIEDIIARHKKEYPLDSEWSFMENDYKIINNVVIIGCNLYTDYKLKPRRMFRKMYNEYKQPIDKNGRVLAIDPRETLEFKNKFQKLMDKFHLNDINSSEIDKSIRDLYESVYPKNNETPEKFKARVSPEVYQAYENYQNDLDNQGYKELTQKEYKLSNMNIAKRNMNDFRYGKTFDRTNIWSYDRLITPEDYLKWHKQSLKYIDKIYNQFKDSDYKIIVMTHHCPTTKIMAEQWRGADMNASYYSNLDKFILKHPKIEYWICGHIHNRNQVKVGNCQVIANPYGYEILYETKGFKPVIIEL